LRPDIPLKSSPVKLYLFSSVQADYRSRFYQQMRQQNVRVMHFLAIVMLLLETLLFASDLFIDYRSTFKQYEMFRHLSYYFLTTAALFTLLFTLLRKYVPSKKMHRYNIFAILYAALFIGGNVWLSFMPQRNPANTLTMLMMSMMMVSALMVLTLGESMLILIPCGALFTIGLNYFQTNPELWLSNYLGFFFIALAFMAISRLLYSYHVNYFLKVKAIEDKTAETILANESKNEILGIVAHDLRSPVSNIRTLVELMKEYNISPEEKETYMNLILECCEKATSTITDIITTARENSVSTMSVSRENLNAFLREISSGWDQVINGKRKLELTLPGHDIYYSINRDKFHRIMDNLISNAIKFTTEAQGIIHIRLEQHKAMIRILVKDNGIGIPADQIPQLFDKFTPASRPGLNNETSVGLGLNISRQLVEKHNGTLSVLSEENEGSVFYIDLPLETGIIT
jgi:two-component system sensor histidine kinase VicK